jgi:fermentation-respiration switch protein FrsA (DUF1100 family)
MRGIKIIAVTLMVICTALLALPYGVTYFIFRPTPLDRPDPHEWGLHEAKQITFRAIAGARLSGWWQPPPTLEAPVVLLVHGSSANISTRATIAQRLARDGFGALLFDYRGYGHSEGKPSENGINEDALSAYDWLMSEGISPSNVIILGQSLGNVPATRLAATRPSAGLILVSPFTNAQGVIADRVGWPLFGVLPWPRNKFDVGLNLNHVMVPIAFVVSNADGVVPLENSRKLATLSPTPVHWFEDDHFVHQGLLAGVAASGALTQALASVVEKKPH